MNLFLLKNAMLTGTLLRFTRFPFPHKLQYVIIFHKDAVYITGYLPKGMPFPFIRRACMHVYGCTSEAFHFAIALYQVNAAPLPTGVFEKIPVQKTSIAAKSHVNPARENSHVCHK